MSKHIKSCYRKFGPSRPLLAASAKPQGDAMRRDIMKTLRLVRINAAATSDEKPRPHDPEPNLVTQQQLHRSGGVAEQKASCSHVCGSLATQIFSSERKQYQATP